MATRRDGAMDKPGAPRPVVVSSNTKPPPSARVAADHRRKAVETGEVVNGKYLVEKVIGEGGVGIVVSARNIELDEHVALKFLKPEMLVQTDIVARFMREAKAACSIKSEYVANVYDVGTLPDGAPFLVMEYLEGQDLGTIVQQRGRFGYREATEYMMQVCEALAVAHGKGVVHRDIKPENLFLTSRAGMNVVKVLDFGISKTALTGSIFGGALPLVKTQNLMGTPLYMSPEQVRSAEAVDSRSDIWSLGMVLYELLTGTTPFEATNITELCAMILESPMTSIVHHRNDLPAAYVAVLEKCLEKDPAKRYQNVAEVAVALMPFGPRRARICAERAAQALRAAGLIEESSVRFTSTVPPPSPTANDSSSWPSLPADPRNPSVSGAHPALYNGPVATSSAPSVSGIVPPATSSAPVAAVSVPAMPTAPSPTFISAAANEVQHVARASDPAPAPRTSRAIMVFAFIGVAAVAAAAAAFAVNKMSDRSAAAATAAAPPAVVTNAPAATVVAATATQSAPPHEAPPARSVAGTATIAVQAAPVVNAPAKKGPTFSWPPKAAAAPAPQPAPPAKATPSAKKSSEEPDLGY